MKHIIDTDEIEKLPRHGQTTQKDYIHIDDLLALIAQSPKADEVMKDVERLDWMDAVERRPAVVLSCWFKYKCNIREAIDNVRKEL